MRDIHCHILPGVDDGARNLEESLDMLRAAQAAGVTEIVCTPHARKPYFHYVDMRRAFDELVAHADGFPLHFGFEVNHEMLLHLGPEWIDRLAFEDSDEFLYELSPTFSWDRLSEYERTIAQIQRCGFTVIIAHPERYPGIQRDPRLAEELADMGCLLQASADFIAGGRFGRERRPAQKLFKRGLYTYIASDAHHVGHYENLARACARYEADLREAPDCPGIHAGAHAGSHAGATIGKHGR